MAMIPPCLFESTPGPKTNPTPMRLVVFEEHFTLSGWYLVQRGDEVFLCVYASSVFIGDFSFRWKPLPNGSLIGGRARFLLKQESRYHTVS